MGVEPTYSAWEADVLPINYIRIKIDCLSVNKNNRLYVTHLYERHAPRSSC